MRRTRRAARRALRADPGRLLPAVVLVGVALVLAGPAAGQGMLDRGGGAAEVHGVAAPVVSTLPAVLRAGPFGERRLRTLRATDDAGAGGELTPAAASRTGGPQLAPAPRPATPTLLSLAIPGAGQRLLGQRRGWLYLGLEVVGWAFWLERRAAGSEDRDRYRDLAWETARIPSGPRQDGGFPYYETLARWRASGAFDTDPAASGVQPESDPTTYNGSIWTRAIALFVPGGASVPASDPAYQSALAYYDERAYGTPFLWDWSGEEAAREEFARLIEASDDRFRQATNVLGAVIVNHLVSSVDAYLSARGRSLPLDVRAAPGALRGRSVWFASLTLAWPG